MTVEIADQQAKHDLIGEVLANRYQIELKLGEGAMGAVFKAKHVKVGRPFAVKVLHKKLLEDNKVLQRFEREAELAGRLRHPNVVGVVDVGETTDGSKYMVMDFAEGNDLAAMLNEAPMPAERVINLTRQMLDGLYHAHEQGLIHRDFKPENVIVERDDHGVEVPRIVDFGIAILREGGESANSAGRLTTNGLVLGTPHYMAPEQAVADPIDHRIDLFALGIVIYEMLSGKLPFDGTGAEVARANLLLDPPPISQRVPYLEVDPLLEAFARRLMAKKRELRPATAKAARELLDLIITDPEAAAAALGVPYGPSSRAPAVTQPVPPQRQPQDDIDRAFDDAAPVYGRAPSMPPVSKRMPTPLPVKLEAPAMAASTVSAVNDTPAPIARGERFIATDMTERLPPKRSRAPLFAGIGVLLAAAVITVVVIKSSETAPGHVAVQATPAEPTTKDPVKEPVQPPPQKEPVQQEPTVKDPPIQEPTVKDPPPQEPTIKDPPAKPIKPTKTPSKNPVVVKQPDKQPDKVPDVVKQPDPPPTPTVIDAAGLYKLYGDVGRDLLDVSKSKGEDAVATIKGKYRLIQIQDAITTEAKRAENGKILLSLRSQLAALKAKP